MTDAPVAPCAPTATKLESYLDARVPGVYWLDMIHTGPDWQPAAQLAMPFHHATRIALDNLADFPHLAAGGPPTRFTLELTARDLDHDPPLNTWFATYHARILATCPPP